MADNDRMIANSDDPWQYPIIRNPNDPWHRAWGTGSTLIGMVAIVVMALIVAYGASRNDADRATGPSSTISQPSSTGQGGAPAR